MDAIVVDSGGLPAGNYSCEWSGYVAKVSYRGSTFEVKTDNGIRGKAKAVVSINESGGGKLTCS